MMSEITAGSRDTNTVSTGLRYMLVTGSSFFVFDVGSLAQIQPGPIRVR
jgi:hypothetical protein